jgi:nucleotide-binding universal stress UspA family protein
MYKKIMVPLDGSELAECVLPHVKSFIAGCQVGTIILTRVIEPASLSYRSAYVTNESDLTKVEDKTKEIEAKRKSSAEEYLKEMANRIGQEGGVLQTKVIVGKVADSLVDFVESNDIDLILIATHGRSGISRWVRGSIADRILRASSVPVLMVRAPGTMGESKS